MNAGAHGLLLLAAWLTAGCEPAPQSPRLPRAGADGGLALVFKVPTEERFEAVPVAQDGQRVYAQTMDGELVAYSLASGARVWVVPAGESPLAGHPVVVGDLVLAAAGSVRAFDAASGALRWETPLEFGATTHIAAAADGLFLVGTDTVLYAFDVATGTERWRRAVGAGWTHRGRVRALSAQDGVLYVCAQNFLEWNGWRTVGQVMAVDVATGDERWRWEMRYEDSYSWCVAEPLIADDALVLADYGSNNLVVLDRGTGLPRWRHRGDVSGFGALTPPERRGDTLFVASGDRSVRAMSLASGRTIWTSLIGGSARTAAACASVLLAHDHRLHVLDRRTGALLASEVEWTWPDPQAVASRFVVRGDTAWMFGFDYFARVTCPR